MYLVSRKIKTILAVILWTVFHLTVQNSYASGELQAISIDSRLEDSADEASEAEEDALSENKISEIKKDTLIDEVIVTAKFRDINVLDTGNSITVINSKMINRREAQHIEQVLNLAPNVNFSSGSSRGRFFQIRGIGERSQYVEPINPSVGLFIDGIDFSGVGGAATTLDVRQVEVFRGPQGTSYGANAMAGLIDIQSNDPSKKFEGSVESSFSEYESRTFSSVLSGPITDDMAYRLAVQRSKRDGYIENEFLNRDDTNNIDEQTIRGKLYWQVNDSLNVKIVGLYVNAENGYDSFSLDNTRRTLSDQPGNDRQETLAFSVESTWNNSSTFDVVSLIGHSSSDMEYGFDEDWSYAAICADYACGSSAYESVDNYIRDKTTTTLDFRLVSNDQGLLFSGSTDWVAGIYFRDQKESLLREWTYDSDFTSNFDTKNYAIYGQLGSQLSRKLRLTTGLRLEYRHADYIDRTSADYAQGERLWGGKLGLEYFATGNTMLYGLISRGYKAGGINGSSSLDAKKKKFDTEYLWNYETGIKMDWFDGKLNGQLAVFYQQRHKMQVKQSLVDCSGGGACTFTDYFENANYGANYGAELEFNWLPFSGVNFYSSLGLLKAIFKDYESYSHVEVDRYASNPTPKDLSGDKQAHAPSYQFTLGTELDLTANFVAGLEVEGKGAFNLSPRHNAKSNRYELLNSHLSYRYGAWDFSLWGRNLTDRDVIVRGFGSFGNDPRKNYALEPYYQFGEPRVIGATVKFNF
jgi:iron complex outermembrane recepter protein